MAPVLCSSEQERRRSIVHSALQKGHTPGIGDLPTA
jgi:hypothetical protein